MGSGGKGGLNEGTQCVIMGVGHMTNFEGRYAEEWVISNRPMCLLRDIHFKNGGGRAGGGK